MELGPASFFGYIQQFADLFMAVPFHQAQIDDGPVARWKSLDDADQFVVTEFVVGREIIRFPRFHAIGQYRHQLVSFLDPIDTGTDEYAPGPAFKRTLVPK